MNKQQYAERFGRLIQDNEIVFDFDNREFGFHGINFTGINLYNSGYEFEIWYAQGQKSPHLHIKNIQGLENLELEQLKEYKKLFMRKYSSRKYLKFLDIQLIGKHRIAKENETHYKYKTIKKLLGIWNENKENFAEQDLLKEAKLPKLLNSTIYSNKNFNGNAETLAGKIAQKISIIAMADNFGLKPTGRKLRVCPFHADSNPSLSLNEGLGLFNCFGCQSSGNIILFYTMLKKLNPKFRIEVKK